MPNAPTASNEEAQAPTGDGLHRTSHSDAAARKLEAAKRRLDRALNTLERRVAVHSERLRQTNASDVGQLRAYAQKVEQEKGFLVGQLERLDAYLGDLEAQLQTPPALPGRPASATSTDQKDG